MAGRETLRADPRRPARARKWILPRRAAFANGDIHIGHVINKTLKDIIIRFRSMQGFETPYVPGWDCHGLPIEHNIQEEIKKEGKNIREMSILTCTNAATNTPTNTRLSKAFSSNAWASLAIGPIPISPCARRTKHRTLEVFAQRREGPGLSEAQAGAVVDRKSDGACRCRAWNIRTS